jgi:hypothetical protein
VSEGLSSAHSHVRVLHKQLAHEVHAYWRQVSAMGRGSGRDERDGIGEEGVVGRCV